MTLYITKLILFMLNIFFKAILKDVGTSYKIDSFTILKALFSSQSTYLKKVGDRLWLKNFKIYTLRQIPYNKYSKQVYQDY